MMRLWLPFLLIPLLIYVGIVFIMWSMQSRLVYFPDRHMVADPATAGLPFEDVSLITADDETLHGWYVAADPTRPVILFLHGNAGNVSHRIDTLNLFHNLNVNVLLIDYRGYGKSTGKPTEHGTYLDATAAWDYLVETKGIDPAAVIIFGRSLGGGVAGWLASQKPSGALVLESTFTSIADLGAESYRWLPVRLLTRIHYDTRSRLKNVKTPTVVLHSKDDDIIAFHHGEALFAAASNPLEFVPMVGDHNSGYMVSEDIYVDAWQRIIQRVTKR